MSLRLSPMLLGALLSACSSDFDLSGRRSSTRTVGLAAPSGLSGQARHGGTEIALAWTDRSTVETGFRVELSTRPMSTLQDVEEWTVVGADVTSVVHASRAGLRYFARVYAVTDTHQSAPSEEIAVVTASAPPSAPPSLSAEGQSPSSIRLDWTDVDEESGYVIERAPLAGGPWTVLPADVAADTTTYVDGGLPSNAAYRYRVAAVNVLGAGAYSNEADGWTLTAGTWTTAYPTPEDDGYNTSIAAESGTPYIAYYETTRAKTWVRGPGPLREIDGASGAAGTSTAVSSGIAHVATIAPNQLRRFSGTSSAGFSFAVVNPANNWSALPKMLASGATREYVGVSSTSGASLLYWLEGAGGNYVVSGYLQILGLALTKDAAGGLHVAYTAIAAGGGSPGLYYGFKNPGGVQWNVTALPFAGRPTHVSVATERTGTGWTPNADVPHVVYYDSQFGRLYHLWRPDLLVGTGFRIETIDAPAGRHVGAYNGMARSGSTLHVVYYDATRGDLRHAKRVFGSGWQLSTLDAVGDVGTHASIAVDGGTIYVAYRDETNGDLKLATGTP